MQCLQGRWCARQGSRLRLLTMVPVYDDDDEDDDVHHQDLPAPVSLST